LTSKYRANRLPVIPTDVCRYKADDLGHWQQTIAKSKYYRFDARHNRYCPNLRYFIYSLHKQMFKNQKVARLVSKHNQSRVDRFLHDLGCGTLRSLQSPPLQAFPVIFENSSAAEMFEK
jgi:hypothetical protein